MYIVGQTGGICCRASGDWKVTSAVYTSDVAVALNVRRCMEVIWLVSSAIFVASSVAARSF